MGPTAEQIIRQYAPKFGLDWRAVRAYALEESSGRWNAVGDQGTSFGPFQMHRGGALGSHPGSWAESPAGLIAGMRMMANTPIRGRQGAEALRAIYTYFGKGSNNAAAFARALPYLTAALGGSVPAVSPQGPGETLAGASQVSGAPTIDRGVLAQGLMAAFQANGGVNTAALMSAITKARVQPVVESAPLHQVAPGSDTVTTGLGTYPTDFTGKYPAMLTGGRSPYSNLAFASHADWQHVDTSLLDRMNILARRLGVTITVISGYRAPGYSASVGGYSNDPHTRGVAVDAYVGNTPIGDVPHAVQLLHELGLESGAQANFYRGKSDPEHVQVPGSGVNKRIHAKRTHAAWR